MSIETGTRGELAIAERLAALGLPVEKTHHYAPYDLGVGGVRVEVKTCETVKLVAGRECAVFACAPQRRGPKGEATFKDYAADSDFMVLLWAGNAEYPERVWVIPSAAMPRGFSPNLEVTRRRSKWDAFENRFDLIKQAHTRGETNRKVGDHVPKSERRRSARASIPSALRPPVNPEEARAKMQAAARATAEQRKLRSDAAIAEARTRLIADGITRPSRRRVAEAAGVSMATVARWNREHRAQE